MPTTVIKTIKSAGGDYTTPVAWEAGIQADLTLADEIRVGEIYDVNPTAVLTIDGSVTDATRYIKLTVAPAYRHAGVYNEAKQFWTYTGTIHVLVTADPYTQVEWFQGKNTSGTGGGLINVSETGCTIRNSIGKAAVKAAGDSACFVYCSGSGTNALIRNCIGYGFRHGVMFNANMSGGVIENCTLVDCTFGVSATSTSALTIRNVYAQGVTRDYNHGGGATLTGWTIQTCAQAGTSQATGITGGVAYSTANFVNVTSGSEDLHLASGSALIGIGTDLSASFIDDIDDQQRLTPWDIGADQAGAIATDDNLGPGGINYGTIDEVAINEPVGVSSTPPQTGLATAAIVTLSVPTPTVIPGAVTIVSTAPTFNFDNPTPTVIPGAVSVIATSPSFTFGFTTPTTSIGFSLTATAGLITFTGPLPTVVSGGVTKIATSSIFTFSNIGAVVNAGPVTIASTAALISLTAPVAIWLSGVTSAATTSSITFSGPVGTVVPGALSRAALAGAFTFTNPASVAAPSGVTRISSSPSFLFSNTGAGIQIGGVIRLSSPGLLSFDTGQAGFAGQQFSSATSGLVTFTGPVPAILPGNVNRLATSPLVTFTNPLGVVHSRTFASAPQWVFTNTVPVVVPGMISLLSTSAILTFQLVTPQPIQIPPQFVTATAPSLLFKIPEMLFASGEFVAIVPVEKRVFQVGSEDFIFLVPLEKRTFRI